MDESPKELLQLAIVEIGTTVYSQSPEIYLGFDVDLGDNIKVTIPQLGDKKHLVELSERNAKYFRMERFKQMQLWTLIGTPIAYGPDENRSPFIGRT